MDIPWDEEAVLRSRPNRFIGIVDIPALDLQGERVHVHDPGRLKELLFSGARVLLRREEKQTRKTKWDIIAAAWGERWILVHTGYHRRITEHLLKNASISPFGRLRTIRSEVSVGKSRIDFLVTQEDGTRTLIEVKGCTLTQNGIALFPDAPTERGRRHLETLMDQRKEGLNTAFIILIFRSDSRCFLPNLETDPRFSETFYRARREGVNIYPLVFEYRDGTIYYLKEIPVCDKSEGDPCL
jgi:sugar fermentation stimulation protein A